jgi:hypothetical protein
MFKQHIQLEFAVLIAFVGVFGAIFFASPSATALSSDPKMFISGDNTFFVYAKAGEKLSANFTKSGQFEPLGLSAEDIVVSIEGPGVAQQKCTLGKDIAQGQGCGFKDIVAAKTGIWKVQFAVPTTAKLYTEVSPTVRWTRNLFSWNITVADGSGEKKGRIWSELYAVRQPNDASFTTDLAYFYISEDGYLYKANYKGYHGQISTLSADAFGIRVNDTCVSAYTSISVLDKKMSPSFGQCGGSYKLFLEQPAGDLPTKAEKWDGTSDWVRPSISRPMVSDLSFKPDGSTDQLSGKITFNLKNFVGQYEVKIDTNNDGNYDAGEDIKITRQIKKLQDASQEVEFKGVDGDDQPVIPSQRIGIKINISRLAEIHLVNADVEGRTGGLEITRLSGDNAPRSNMCWNDTELEATGDPAIATPKVDGRACPDSSGGSHSWAYGTGAWGDTRYIDDWAYAAAKVDGTAEIHYPQQAVSEEVAAKASRTGLGMVIGGISAIAAIIAVIVLIILKKRHKKPAQYASTHDDITQPPVQ